MLFTETYTGVYEGVPPSVNPHFFSFFLLGFYLFGTSINFRSFDAAVEVLREAFAF